ncbi:MAG: glycerol kinase GlpK [Spirochaetes bacterium]|nr:glycerol kinase GlpK [Spirochaetota bacterium]
MKPYMLAIDQGTTSSRALVFDVRGKVVAMAQREFPQYFPKPGWVEHDGLEIWDSVRLVVAEVLRKIGPHQIAAIGIANQRETTLLWDRETGMPISRAIVWQSRQSASICETLKKQGLEPLFMRRSGLRLDPYFSATKIRFLLDGVRGARRRAREGSLCFGTIDTWLLWKLTGGKVFATDATNASRTLLYDLRLGAWSRELCEAIDIPMEILPEIRPSSGLFGESIPKHTGGVPLPICGMAGDQQAALFGQACYLPGSVKNTYGTGCFMLMNTGTKPVFSKHGLLTTVAWQLPGERCFALEGSVFVAGSAIQWLRDGLGLLRSSSESESLARSVDSNAGVYLVPAFAGLGTPWWDPNTRGAFFGLTRGATRAHFVRAALESMAYQTRDVLAAMAQDSGRRLALLRVDGGASKNAFLMQFQSDLLGIPVERPRNTETTAFGAAALAGLAVGFWKDRATLSRTVSIERRWKPALPRKKADLAYGRWLNAVAAARRFARAPKRLSPLSPGI